MKRKHIASFFALVRSGLQSKPLSEAERSAVSPEQLPTLVALSKKFDMEHLLDLGLRQNGITLAQTASMEKSVLLAVFRWQRMENARQKLYAALEKAQIPFLPLKGSVIGEFYPEPWMRTSCDMDILVRQSDAKKAAALLEADYGYTLDKTDSHDISLYAPNKAHLELHYDLIEHGLVRNADRVLRTVWDRATVKEGTSCHYQMPDDLFYCYHIAHMAKHFAIGGCGVRPFVDLWILDSRMPQCQACRDSLLEQAGLLKFARAARALSQAWLSNAPMDPLAEEMETYILRGGMYCDNENRIAVQQQTHGRLRYLLVRIFLPFNIIKFRYPILQKHPWLMPAMQVRRWCKLLFCGHMGRISRDLSYGRSISAEKEKNTKQFLENLGLLPE